MAPHSEPSTKATQRKRKVEVAFDQDDTPQAQSAKRPRSSSDASIEMTDPEMSLILKQGITADQAQPLAQTLPPRNKRPGYRAPRTTSSPEPSSSPKPSSSGKRAHDEDHIAPPQKRSKISGLLKEVAHTKTRVTSTLERDAGANVTSKKPSLDTVATPNQKAKAASKVNLDAVHSTKKTGSSPTSSQSNEETPASRPLTPPRQTFAEFLAAQKDSGNDALSDDEEAVADVEDDFGDYDKYGAYGSDHNAVPMPNVRTRRKRAAKASKTNSRSRKASIEDAPQPGSLMSFLRNQEMQSRASNTLEYHTKKHEVVRRNLQFHDDDDEGLVDRDYHDNDVSYGVDPADGEDPDDAAKRHAEEIDPTYDPFFVARETDEKSEIKLPSYQATVENEEISAERDEEAKAWKTLNKVVGNQVLASASEEYTKWHKQCITFFQQGTKNAPIDIDADPVSLPEIIHEECGYSARDCTRAEVLGICQHDVQRVLKGSGVQIEGDEWLERLKRERLRWHPDKFSMKMDKKWVPFATELFQLLQALIDKEMVEK